jgi:L-fuconolactonase
MRLDAHQHFWHYSPAAYTWITDEMDVLKRDYLPDDLKPLLQSIGFDGCIAVQARQSLDDTRFLLDLAEKYEFIKAVVGWVDLCSSDLLQQLKEFACRPKFVGVRHVLQDEPDDHFMLRPDFRQGIALLHEFDLSYDLLIHPRHLKTAVQLVAEFPQQPFVLDHLAKPPISKAEFSPWQEDLRQLAKLPNVCCKLSGLMAEVTLQQASAQDFARYLDITFAAFGWQRLMIGSDWPVCTLGGAYKPVMEIVIDYVKKYSTEAQAAILGGNCARFYRVGSGLRR